MKSNSACWLCLAVVIASTAAAFAEGDGAAGSTPIKPLSTVGGPSGGNNLTEAQIAELLTQATDEKTGAKLHFYASFHRRSIKADEKNKYARSGKVPFQITCTFTEVRDVGGKALSKRLGGTAHLMISDADGKVVEKRSVSLDKMCPS